MKATLTFNLENPDERIEHLRCVKALDLALAVHDIVLLFEKIEYEEALKNKDMSAKQLKSFAKAYIFDVLNNYDINLETLCE